MKLTTGILGCALAAGLMTFAPNTVQAGVVIGGNLYSPLKLKITVTYSQNGKLKKATVSSKDALKELGYPKSDSLAVSRYSGDVWVINKDTLKANVSTNGYLTVNLDWIVYANKGNTYTEAGTSEVVYYEGGYAYGTESANWFDISGVYTYKDNDGKIDKNGYYMDDESYDAPALSGRGHISVLGDVPITGSASYHGTGKLPQSS